MNRVNPILRRVPHSLPSHPHSNLQLRIPFRNYMGKANLFQITYQKRTEIELPKLLNLRMVHEKKPQFIIKTFIDVFLNAQYWILIFQIRFSRINHCEPTGSKAWVLQLNWRKSPQKEIQRDWKQR